MKLLKQFAKHYSVTPLLTQITESILKRFLYAMQEMSLLPMVMRPAS